MKNREFPQKNFFSLKNGAGFTLIELVIVITIIGIITGVVAFTLLGAVDAWTFKFNRSELLSDGRLAMNRMVREIREIKNRGNVTKAKSSEFRFINTSDVDIKYKLDNGDLLNRTEDGTKNLLAEYVSDLTFTYFDSSGATIAIPDTSPDATDIRRIRIDMTFTKSGENVYLQSQSVPRNF